MVQCCAVWSKWFRAHLCAKQNKRAVFETPVFTSTSFQGHIKDSIRPPPTISENETHSHVPGFHTCEAGNGARQLTEGKIRKSFWLMLNHTVQREQRYTVPYKTSTLGKGAHLIPNQSVPGSKTVFNPVFGGRLSCVSSLMPAWNDTFSTSEQTSSD